MAAEPFSISASLSLPPDTGQPNETLTCNFAGTFNSGTQQKLNLAGSGTHVVSFGTVPSFRTKVLWLEYEKPETGNPPPIDVSINGGAVISLQTGGFLVMSNLVIVTSLSVTFTAACVVRVALLN